jgi:hypothetical protein
MHRRSFATLRWTLAGALACAALSAPLAAEPKPDAKAEVRVYKSPTCGCCEKWVDHLRAEGFTVHTSDVPDLAPIKQENGIAPELSACHTAFVGGYVVEGHVPASDIRRLLAERPKVAGLAVPGMPIGSPGMEGPNAAPYEVLSFGGQGVRVFSKHTP